MTIKHIHVEGGFLTGLELRLKPGLNVLIGARGTGKTSVIELIRYAFGARNQTAEGTEQSLKHARATLADGEVRLTVSDILDDVTFARTATEDEPRDDGFYDGQLPIIFSQKEIENVALSEQGRLNLIDAFVPGRSKRRREETGIIDRVTALDRVIRPLRIEILQTDDELTKRASVAEKIDQLRGQQAALRKATEIDIDKQMRAETLSRVLTGLVERIDRRTEVEHVVSEWIEALSDLPVSDLGHIVAEGDPDLQSLASDFESALAQVTATLNQFEAIKARGDAQRANLQQQRVRIEGEFRQARAVIDEAIAGAGAVEKQLHDAQAEAARLDVLARHGAERGTRLAAAQTERADLLDQLEKLRSNRFNERKAIVDRLNEALAPNIKVSAQRAAQYGAYTSALVEALRGSGLKYNDVAVSLAKSVSPRELVGYIEAGDFDQLASATGLPRERASRVVNALADAGTAQLLTVSIEDTIRLRLLDGTEYKDISDLSAGQRCTVTLPIVLQHSDRILIIDQPEDHIDNAFIVDTLIRSLRSRANNTQIILATHNANIPVLGNADWVVQLMSDGRHGTVAVAEPLEDTRAVDAITSVMEGGLQAFRDRAAFYDTHTL